MLDHDLMADTRPGRVEIDAMLARKRFDPGVLAEVLRRRVLDVVIDRKNGLGWVENVCRTDRLEFAHHRRRIVVRHNVLGADVEKIAGVGPLPRLERSWGCVASDDFLDKRLWH